MKTYLNKMKNNRYCKCKPRCYYLHRMDNEINRWKKSPDYRAFKLTYEYLQISEQFNWQTIWRPIRKADEVFWGIESKPRRKTVQTHENYLKICIT